MKQDFIFYQLFESESSTYTYIIADTSSREAAIIDPVLEKVERDLKLISEERLQLKYVLDTHVHADHITGASQIRERTKAKTGLSRHSGVDCADLLLKEGDELLLGSKKIKVLETPGHTNTCLSFLFEDMIFTGDALLIRGTGRTDFQQGSSEKLFESIHQKVFTLPPETKVYPAHDYNGQTASTIEMEKRHNPRLGVGQTKESFVQIMAHLKLAHPKKIHEAVPANMSCGKTT
ncbi:MBL fold metallo-hydrolase [bacterium]|nr:MBL fold metallo-hydrolase [bacterium]